MSTLAIQSPRNTPVVADPKGFELPRSQSAVIRWNIYIAFAALFVAVAHGFAQAMSYANIDVLGWFPGLKNYYQGLTIHGVFNGLVLTFGFTNGFLALTTARAFGRPLNRGLLFTSFGLLALGVALAGWAMVSGNASVLYTFYPPLQAHWAFYLGLALMVVSTWTTGIMLFAALRGWRKEHPGERIPLLAFASVATYGMWILASIGVAIEVVVFLLPWSLGIMDGIDPLFSRTLFWFSGHPLVYFWLLPAYISWYMMVPRQAGGQLHSDALTRIVFILFVLLSIPTGFHHQYTDPGIPAGMKAVHAVMTFGVFFPSMITAFSIVSALELGGRRRGGKGLVGWFFKLPWGDPSLAAQVLAMLVFVLGGVTGLINASYSVNQVIHNTTWVPGHFHMTVGTAVALTFIGVAYWLVPLLTGRELWGRRLAVVQSWIYFVGILIFARGMVSGGLEGLPRRTFRAAATYTKESWDLAGIWTAVGGTLMTISIAVFAVVLVMTIFFGKKREGQDVPFTSTIHGGRTEGWELKLDDVRWFIILAIIIVAIAYGPFLITYLPPALSVPGFRLF